MHFRALVHSAPYDVLHVSGLLQLAVGLYSHVENGHYPTFSDFAFQSQRYNRTYVRIRLTFACEACPVALRGFPVHSRGSLRSD